ncbi:hypothetical protein AAVH_20882 [Aphelenchoides avenae]|nr:hypothetical protein AAVH_20882 [Aphelenchus avenae]
MPSVLIYLSLAPLEVLAAVPVLFALMPVEFQVYWSNITSGLSAADAQSCLDQSWAADNATIVFGYSYSGACTYGRAILGYQTRTSTDPQYWVRVDNIIRPTNICLNHQDAEYLMMKHTFGGKNCPRYGPNLFSGGPETLCRSNTSLGMYGAYEAGGHMPNGTVEVLTKTYATTGVSYQCDDVYTHKVRY